MNGGRNGLVGNIPDKGGHRPLVIQFSESERGIKRNVTSDPAFRNIVEPDFTAATVASVESSDKFDSTEFNCLLDPQIGRPFWRV